MIVQLYILCIPYGTQDIFELIADYNKCPEGCTYPWKMHQPYGKNDIIDAKW